MKRSYKTKKKAIRELIETFDYNNRGRVELLLYMWGKSEGFTKEVSLTLIADEILSRDEIQQLALLHWRPIHYLMEILGSKLIYSVHYGWYENNEFRTDGQFPNSGSHQTGPTYEPSEKYAYTFWFSKNYWGQDSKGDYAVQTRLRPNPAKFKNKEKG